MAAAWMWILAYVVVFIVFQLLLYRYLQDGERRSVEHAAPDYGDGDVAPGRATQSLLDTDADEGVRCQRCGTYNERSASFTYCRECVARLQ